MFQTTLSLASLLCSVLPRVTKVPDGTHTPIPPPSSSYMAHRGHNSACGAVSRAFIVVVIVVVLLGDAAAAGGDDDEPAHPSHLTVDPRGSFSRSGVSPDNERTFVCQVCKAFCREYDDAVRTKKGDTHYNVAIAQAEQNLTQFYVWDDAKHALGRGSPVPGHSVSAGAHIREVLDPRLTRYNREVILNALHAAGHLQLPPRAPFQFCIRIFCVQRTHMCSQKASGDDGRPFHHLQQAFDTMVHSFDAVHVDGELHPTKRAPTLTEDDEAILHHHHHQTPRRTPDPVPRGRRTLDAFGRLYDPESDVDGGPHGPYKDTTATSDEL